MLAARGSCRAGAASAFGVNCLTSWGSGLAVQGIPRLLEGRAGTAVAAVPGEPAGGVATRRSGRSALSHASPGGPGPAAAKELRAGAAAAAGGDRQVSGALSGPRVRRVPQSSARQWGSLGPGRRNRTASTSQSTGIVALEGEGGRLGDRAQACTTPRPSKPKTERFIPGVGRASSPLRVRAPSSPLSPSG